MSYNDLVIINNEKISNEKNNFYCDNIDIKSIPENLSKNFNKKNNQPSLFIDTSLSQTAFQVLSQPL